MRLSSMHTSPAMLKGTAVHEALAEWFRLHGKEAWDVRATKMVEVFEKSMRSMSEQYEDQDRLEDDIKLGSDLLSAYALDNVTETVQEVVAIEHPMSFTFETGDVFTGRMDLAYIIDGRLYIVDHKTTGWALSSLVRTLMVSDQANGYLWLWNSTNPDRPAHGLIYNILRQYKTSTEFKQCLVMKTDTDLERFAGDAQHTINEIASKMASPQERWVRNTGACFNYNRPCEYLDLCMGANFEGLIGTKFRMEEEPENGKTAYYGECVS